MYLEFRNVVNKVRQRMFSLMELLIVIAIIIILASLLLPVLKQARDKGKQINCLSNLRQIGIATRQYIDDNNGFLPDRDGRMQFFIGEKLRDYLKFGLPLGQGNAMIVCCPAQNPHAKNGGWLIDYGHCAGAFGVTAAYCPGKRDSAISGNIFVLIDAFITDGSYVNKDFRSQISYRHFKFANILYYGGHVGSEKNIGSNNPGWTK